jgi:hypothetical protein
MAQWLLLLTLLTLLILVSLFWCCYSSCNICCSTVAAGGGEPPLPSPPETAAYACEENNPSRRSLGLFAMVYNPVLSWRRFGMNRFWYRGTRDNRDDASGHDHSHHQAATNSTTILMDSSRPMHLHQRRYK